MDDLGILRPQLIRIGKRQYRKLAFEGCSSQNTLDNLDYSPYNDDYNDDEESDEESISIETVPNGFKLCMDVPSQLVKFICGKKMENKINIERETKTKIKLPEHGAECPVVITSSSKKGISLCRHRIELIMESSRQRLQPTHFLSFPLFSQDLIRSFEKFKMMALEKCKKSKGIDPSIFTIPEKFHLTIGAMTLLTENEVKSAGSLLENCFEEVIRAHVGEEPIVINLKGLGCMNGDPSKVDVLYANVYEIDGSTRLQELADAVLSYFTSKGLMKEKHSKVKLHATVMTTRLRDSNNQKPAFSKSLKDNTKSGFNTRMSFDARQMIEVFKDFEFGEHHLECIHLSQRGVFDSNGYYHCCKSVALP